MNAERSARLFVIGLLLGLPLAAFAALWLAPGRGLVLHASIAEAGGWTPVNLRAQVGQPLRLRLTSDDVAHGFAVGQTDWPAVRVMPGQVTETVLTFQQPGTYTFYCTTWCGPNHWRMRGTIEVTGPTAPLEAVTPPLYARLGLDIDAPHVATNLPTHLPSAARGAALGWVVPSQYLAPDYYRAHSPAELWRALRTNPTLQAATDDSLWDLVAATWRQNASPQALQTGAQLYVANCAACHGEAGDGMGVYVSSASHAMGSDMTQMPADFTAPWTMLGASPALLQGKILRGGMGTGMPSWGPIFSDSQTWALVAYLYSFQWENSR
jgi:mono/diheme cytochrome c family protein/plastocyanin